jgi:hypothetical protein
VGEFIAALFIIPITIVVAIVGEQAIASAISDAELPFLVSAVLTAVFPGSLILYLLGQ